QGVIENAALALAKSDMGIARCYAELVSENPTDSAVWRAIETDHQRSVDLILRITRRDGLLDKSSWLHESIELRNPYVDALNMLQIVLLQRQLVEQEAANSDRANAASETTAELLRLTIQGIAGGLRATG
ncbi:MAG TPA: phosphoenolpyruvate carboxylase, partial [Pirellulaceae bacterium]|nr:phosphoenolpyruvate carboxylase [Pirellulaceae bacterium]